MSTKINSILVLDDEQNELDLLTHLLKPHLSANLVCTKFPTQAIQLAREHCFDVILLDVTLSYGGSQFGGLEVYKALHSRYGASSIVAYSQFINDELLQRYGLSFNFVEKHASHFEWVSRLVQELQELRERQTCFVAMPFGVAYSELYRAVESSVTAAGYRCVRVDQEIFTRSIVDKIFEEISAAKFVVFVATGSNPNVFFEAGYAVALGKEVLTVAEHFNGLPFDIRDRSAIAYGSDPSSVSETLAARLYGLTLVR